jgi:hypothetical protein
MCGNEGALNLGDRRKCQLHVSATASQGEIVLLTIYIGGCVGANGRPGHFAEQLNLWHLPGIEPGILTLPADDQITIPTDHPAHTYLTSMRQTVNTDQHGIS